MHDAGEVPHDSAVAHGQRRRAAPAVPRRLDRPRSCAPRCSSTSGTTAARSPSWCACSSRAAAWRSRSPPAGPSASTGRSTTSTTTARRATCASSASTSSSRTSKPPGSGCAVRTTRTACTRRTGGSGAPAASTSPTARSRKRYHDFLVWQLTKNPSWLAAVDRALNPVMGKSLVIYTQKVDR